MCTSGAGVQVVSCQMLCHLASTLITEVAMLQAATKHTCTAVMGGSSGSLKGLTVSTTLSSRPGMHSHGYQHTTRHISEPAVVNLCKTHEHLDFV
jgi:hypothetical protein